MTTQNTTPSPNTVGSASASTKPCATPVPKSYDRILPGALKLPLKERADIANALIAANKAEASLLEAKAKEAATIINGA